MDLDVQGGDQLQGEGKASVFDYESPLAIASRQSSLTLSLVHQCVPTYSSLIAVVRSAHNESEPS